MTKPVAGPDVDTRTDLTESSCIDLVRWTGLLAHPDKRGKHTAAEEAPPDGLWSIANHARRWIWPVRGTDSRYCRAIGSAEALILKAADHGQHHRQWSSRDLRGMRKKRLRNAVMPG